MVKLKVWECDVHQVWLLSIVSVKFIVSQRTCTWSSEPFPLLVYVVSKSNPISASKASKSLLSLTQKVSLQKCYTFLSACGQAYASP